MSGLSTDGTSQVAVPRRTRWGMYRARDLWVTLSLALVVCGCTGPREYFRNGFKVGPNVTVPLGETAPQWIDEADLSIPEQGDEMAVWWTVFRDPVLDELIAEASNQNLSLREAGYRVLQARSQLAITRGNLLPQYQTAFGGYQREAASQEANTAPGFGEQFFDQWAFGFNLTWELDFWGRFRRAVTAAEHTLEASCANYDHVLVTLQADVASNYLLVRTLQQRLEYVRANAGLQRQILGLAERRQRAGDVGASDFLQARSALAQTEAQIPQLQFGIRQACNRLCILLGTPPFELEQVLGTGPIPTAPTEVAVGIPAELLRRRPDVRRAERLAAAQGEQIGIAESDLYPIFYLNGTLGYQSENLSQLFQSSALTGAVGPVFEWNILNYGRIRNNMEVQRAEFMALLAAYHNTVLQANAEVEDGLAAFHRAHETAVLLDSSVADAQKAVELMSREYQRGATNYQYLALLQQNLVLQRDLQAQAHGQIAQGLVQVYRALGGGWKVRCLAVESTGVTTPEAMPEPLPQRESELPAENAHVPPVVTQ